MPDDPAGEGGPAPEWLIEQTQTTANVFLTVYPQSFDISDADYAILGSQLVNCPLSRPSHRARA
jgi:hypothetical protein